MPRSSRHKNKKDKKKRKKKQNMDKAFDFGNDKDNWEPIADGKGWRYIGKPTKVLAPVKHATNSWDGESWRDRHGLAGNSSYTGYGHVGGYAGGGSTYVYSGCDKDHSPSIGVKVGDVTLYPTADKYINAESIKEFDVVVPLIDSLFNMASVVEKYLGLVMWFPIKDYSAPDPTKLLITARRILDFAKGGCRVAFWCVGSHGRTGTVLATCIGIAEPDVDPIEETRKRHCKKCVETQSQIECVFHALGREVPEKYRPKSNPVGFTQEGWREGTTVKAENNWSIGCAFCSEKSPIRGCYPMRESADGKKIYCHLDCHQSAKDAEERKKADDAKAQAGATPDVTTKGDTAPLVVDHEAYKALLDQTRPFQSTWEAGDLAMVDGFINDTDTWGDIICTSCHRLIVDPNKIVIKPLPEINGAVEVTHSNCNDFKDDADCAVLCKICCETDISLNKNNKDQVCVECAKDGA